MTVDHHGVYGRPDMTLKCRKCVNEGKKSRVTQGMSTSTLVYLAPFYDEDGKYHNHDPNTSKTDYRCSNGHEFARSHGPTPCWCGWPKFPNGEKVDGA